MARPILHHLRTRAWHLFRWPVWPLVIYWSLLGGVLWICTENLLASIATNPPPSAEIRSTALLALVTFAVVLAAAGACVGLALVLYFGALLARGSLKGSLDARTRPNLALPHPALPLGRSTRPLLETGLFAFVLFCGMWGCWSIWSRLPLPASDITHPGLGTIIAASAFAIPATVPMAVSRPRRPGLGLAFLGAFYVFAIALAIWLGALRNPLLGLLVAVVLTKVGLATTPAFDRIREGISLPAWPRGRGPLHRRAHVPLRRLWIDIIRFDVRMACGGPIMGGLLGLGGAVTAASLVRPHEWTVLAVGGFTVLGFVVACGAIAFEPANIPLTVVIPGGINNGYRPVMARLPMAIQHTGRSVYANEWIAYGLVAGPVLLLWLLKGERLSPVFPISCILLLGILVTGPLTAVIIGRPRQQTSAMYLVLSGVFGLMAYLIPVSMLIPRVSADVLFSSLLVSFAGIVLCAIALTWDTVVSELKWVRGWSMVSGVAASYAAGISVLYFA